ncbi:Serpentine Receptor, class H [Caenorhabditis elegans]|uniref:Serpentine Receptor, class H n=1 Tax=Caenorhabditis elegans TaxID=6239 RepID=Q9U3G2_CAEEL|nr:Serpentine Receptor, class H [Caenorhabditis elegans]CAB63200.1 Serpentine Receptor, class H [Caenorhabditis elegans]|eukprot:NP_507350.1 Serpentine Receptor, class H [Caenorhabditis elegans]
MCSTTLSFFASDINYSKFLHAFTILEIFIHSFGAYIIIAKTPKRLESVKASMLFLHFVGAFVDVYFSVLIMPVLHLPVCGGHPLGLLSFFGVPVLLQTYVGLSLPAVIVATIVVFLDDRRYRLVNGQKSSKIRKWYRLLFVTSSYVSATMYPAPVFFLLPDQESGRLVLKSKSQCIPTDVFDHPNFFLLDLNGNNIAICMLLLMIILISQLLMQFGLIFRHLLKSTPISRSTIRLQQQFFIAMSMQVILPIVIIAFPAFYILFSIISGYHNQGATNIAFMVMSIHGVLSTLTMLMAYRHYRESILEMLNLNLYRSGGSAQRIWKLSKRTITRF